MDKNAALEAVQKFRKALETKNIRVEKMILFGSFVTGAQHEGSDIDVAVISSDFRDRGYWERIEILSEAVYQVFEPIEAVAFTPEEWERGDKPTLHYARAGEVVFE